jgi:CRISPR-associated protein Cst2
MDNLENKIQGLVGKYQESDKKIIYGSINEVVNAFVETIPGLIE